MKQNEFLLEDLKNRYGFHQYHTGIDKILKRYQLKKGSFEYSEYSSAIFKDLGWQNNSAKDILTPFWRIFSAALVFFSKNHEFKRGQWCLEEVEPTYILDNDNCLRYRTYYDKIQNKNGYPISKEKLGLRYHERNTTHCNNIIGTVEIFPDLETLSLISDSIANFSPCPESPFNAVKGLLPDVCDYLNLMVDKVQSFKDMNKDLDYIDSDGSKRTVSNSQVVKWHEWLICNRESFCLEDYYTIENNTIKGTPLFQGQSLNNPLPKSKKDIESALRRIIQIIYSRNEKMTCLLKTN